MSKIKPETIKRFNQLYEDTVRNCKYYYNSLNDEPSALDVLVHLRELMEILVEVIAENDKSE